MASPRLQPQGTQAQVHYLSRLGPLPSTLCSGTGEGALPLLGTGPNTFLPAQCSPAPSSLGKEVGTGLGVLVGISEQTPLPEVLVACPLRAQLWGSATSRN